MLGAVSHIPEKVVNRHFPGTLKITVCPPANAKNSRFRVNLTATCYQSYVVPRWGSGPVLEGVWGGVRFVLGGGGLLGGLREPVPESSSEVSFEF